MARQLDTDSDYQLQCNIKIKNLLYDIKERHLLLFFFLNLIYYSMLFKWLTVTTGFFYMVLGVVILWKKWFFIPLEDFAAYALGALMIAYGIFRMVRVLYKVKNSDDEN